jgi:hypothetical protein
LSRDRFDILTLIGLAGVVLVTLFLLLGSGGRDLRLASGPSQATERALQERAQAAFFAETYAPVEELLAVNKPGEALLRLEQIERDLPAEAHTALLRGGILVRQGALVEGIGEYVRAVRSRADYVDTRSPLQRRAEIEQLLATALPVVQSQAQTNPDNQGLNRALRDLHYLQSRLAGGCE